MFKLRGNASVLGDNGPTVCPHLPLVPAESQHRLDGEDHLVDDFGVEQGSGVVVGNDEAAVKGFADTVPGEIADDSVAEAFGIGLDGSADDVDGPAGRNCLDATSGLTSPTIKVLLLSP